MGIEIGFLWDEASEGAVLSSRFPFKEEKKWPGADCQGLGADGKFVVFPVAPVDGCP